MMSGYEDIVVRSAYYIGQEYAKQHFHNPMLQQYMVTTEIEHILESVDEYLEEVWIDEYGDVDQMTPLYHRIVQGMLAIAEYFARTIFVDGSLLQYDIVFCGYIPQTGTIVIDRISTTGETVWQTH